MRHSLGGVAPVKTGAEPDRVLLSQTEYADNLSLSRKIALFRMKSESFCVISEQILDLVGSYLRPTEVCCAGLTHSEGPNYCISCYCTDTI